MFHKTSCACRGSLNWLIPVGFAISLVGVGLVVLAFELLESSEAAFAVFLILGMALSPGFLIAIAWAGENKAPVEVHKKKGRYLYLLHNGPLREMALRGDLEIQEQPDPAGKNPNLFPSPNVSQ